MGSFDLILRGLPRALMMMMMMLVSEGDWSECHLSHNIINISPDHITG